MAKQASSLHAELDLLKKGVAVKAVGDQGCAAIPQPQEQASSGAGRHLWGCLGQRYSFLLGESFVAFLGSGRAYTHRSVCA